MTILLFRGLGAFPAGVGPAGSDPPDTIIAGVVQATVDANFFDPYDRVYAQNADLTLVGTTATIQRAALLMMPLGALPATASSGIDVVRIRRATDASRANVIADECRRTWKTLLDSKLLAIDAVTLDASDPWNGRFYVDVRDLSTGTSKTLDFAP